MSSGPPKPAVSRVEVEISEASADDADAISALAIKTYVETFGAEFEPNELAWHLKRTIEPHRWVEHLRRDRVLWAKIDGRAIGYVQFGPSETPGQSTVHRLYVVAELQGLGIGSQLLERVLAEPEVAACEAVTIDVWQDNLGARRLYERFGFVDEGKRVPFVSSTGKIEGYDLIPARRPAAA